MPPPRTPDNKTLALPGGSSLLARAQRAKVGGDASSFSASPASSMAAARRAGLIKERNSSDGSSSLAKRAALLAGNGNNSSKKNAATTPTATGAIVATPTPLTPTTTENLAAADLCADGDRRRYGHGCVADATAALACYVAAADAGYAPACARAGLCFESASGVKPDSRAALHFYRRGVGSRDADSLHLLGRACETGALAADKPATASVSDEGDGQGDGEWRDAVADALGNESEPETATSTHFGRFENVELQHMDLVAARQHYRMAAEMGHAEAMTRLGVLYETGRGGEVDDAEAVKWYRKAAELGHADAVNRLGSMFYLGKGAARDVSAALTLYQRASRSGHAAAMNNLGICLEERAREASTSGRGNAEALQTASLKVFAAASAKGNVPAHNNLGYAHICSHDYDAAERAFRLAADRGSPDALYNLAKMAEHGLKEKADLRKAAQLYRAATAAAAVAGTRQRLSDGSDLPRPVPTAEAEEAATSCESRAENEEIQRSISAERAQALEATVDDLRKALARVTEERDALKRELVQTQHRANRAAAASGLLGSAPAPPTSFAAPSPAAASGPMFTRTGSMNSRGSGLSSVSGGGGGGGGTTSSVSPPLAKTRSQSVPMAPTPASTTSIASLMKAKAGARAWRKRAVSNAHLREPISEEARFLPSELDTEESLRVKLHSLLKKRGGESAITSRTISQLRIDLETSHDLSATLGELVKKLWIRTRLQENRLTSNDISADLPHEVLMTHLCGIDVGSIDQLIGLNHFPDVFAMSSTAPAQEGDDYATSNGDVDT